MAQKSWILFPLRFRRCYVAASRLLACGSGCAEWASPQAEAPLLGTDFSEVHEGPIVRTPHAREHFLFDLTSLVRDNEVSFCAGEVHLTIRFLARVLRFSSRLGPIPQDRGNKPHLGVMFVTKRSQAVCELIQERSTSSLGLGFLLSIAARVWALTPRRPRHSLAQSYIAGISTSASSICPEKIH